MRRSETHILYLDVVNRLRAERCADCVSNTGLNCVRFAFNAFQCLLITCQKSLKCFSKTKQYPAFDKYFALNKLLFVWKEINFAFYY